MTRERTVLLVVHTGRDEATETARRVEKVLGDNGIGLRVLAAEAVDHGPVHLDPDDIARARRRHRGRRRRRATPPKGCELVLVLGGDGTFLRAAELARNVEIPVLGVNLGRIGFLAEAEAEAIDTVLDRVINRDYRVEERMTLDVSCAWTARSSTVAGRSTKPAWRRARGSACSAWSSRSTAARCRRSAATVCWCRPRRDRRRTRSPPAGRCCGPTWKRSWWCPTTLTHCSLVRWSPVRTQPSRSRSRRTGHDALVFCDGRRDMVVPAGGRLEVTRCGTPLKWVRLDSAPFTDRLVRKFRLPVTGWRGQ